MKSLWVTGEFKWTLLIKHRIQTGLIILLTEIEIGILTKQIRTREPVRLQTALMNPHLEEVMIALETSIKIIVIQTDTMMGIGTVMSIQTVIVMP